MLPEPREYYKRKLRKRKRNIEVVGPHDLYNRIKKRYSVHRHPSLVNNREPARVIKPRVPNNWENLPNHIVQQFDEFVNDSRGQFALAVMVPLLGNALALPALPTVANATARIRARNPPMRYELPEFLREDAASIATNLGRHRRGAGTPASLQGSLPMTNLRSDQIYSTVVNSPWRPSNYNLPPHPPL